MGSIKPPKSVANLDAALEPAFQTASIVKAAVIAEQLRGVIARELGNSHQGAILCELLNDLLAAALPAQAAESEFEKSGAFLPTNAE
jgi:hypothetical protein